MKRIIAIMFAVVMACSLMLTSVSALDENAKNLYVQFWAQDTATWTWVEMPGTNQTVALGATSDMVFDDIFAFDHIDTTSGVNYGLQVVDQTLTEDGDTSTVTFALSDLVIKAEGYDDYVLPAAEYTFELTAKAESWGLSGNSAQPALDFTGVAGGSDAASLAAYLSSITEATVSVTYLAYNGVTVDGTPYGAAEEAPAEDTEVEAPAEDTTTEAPADEEVEAPAEDTTTEAPAEEEPADTGLALAVVPAIVALAAVAVSKRR